MSLELDRTIQSLERLYLSLTGTAPPASEAPYAPIPPEADAASHIEQQMERLMTLFSAPPRQPAPMAPPPWAPPVTVWEADGELIARFDLPGVSRDTVEVVLVDGTLVVSGEARPPWTVLGENGSARSRVRTAERPFGAFCRRVPLPSAAPLEARSAQLCDGVLEVRIGLAQGTPQTEQTVPIA
jgi:HSP20 family molecular chaperone IbpA